MPVICDTIKGCAYNPATNTAAFNIKNLPVVIEPKKITIYNAQNKAEAKDIVEWLADVIKEAV